MRYAIRPHEIISDFFMNGCNTMVSMLLGLAFWPLHHATLVRTVMHLQRNKKLTPFVCGQVGRVLSMTALLAALLTAWTRVSLAGVVLGYAFGLLVFQVKQCREVA